MDIDLPIGGYKHFKGFVKHIERDEGYSHKSAVKIAGSVEKKIKQKQFCRHCNQEKGTNPLCTACLTHMTI